MRAERGREKKGAADQEKQPGPRGRCSQNYTGTGELGKGEPSPVSGLEIRGEGGACQPGGPVTGKD